MTNIENNEIYLNRMSNSIPDKLFFLDYIDFNKIENFVDFGCADGELISTLHQMYPNINYYGIDCNSQFLCKAAQNCPYAKFLYSIQDFYPAENYLDGFHYNNTVINFSSVFHELFNYCSINEIKAILKNLRRFAYITIRDMWFDDLTTGELDAEDLWKLVKHDKITGDNICDYLDDFLQNGCYRSLYKQSFAEFLLKYKYRENWGRERSEKYFILDKDFIDLLDAILPWHEILIDNYYTLPYLQEQIYDDLGIRIDFHTHAQFILTNTMYKLEELKCRH